MSVEPGLYWAKYVGGNVDIIVRITEGGVSQQMIGAPIAVSLVAVELGPRVPAAEELEGWQDWPMCSECGERLRSTITIGWICMSQDCSLRHKTQDVIEERRYRVRKP